MSRTTALYRRTKFFASAEKEEPDLFEYFDPLVSPHAYPNGISPSEKAVTMEKNEKAPLMDRGDTVPLPEDPLKLRKIARQQTASPSINPRNLPIDPNEVFDPRISPHAYTNGEVPNRLVGDDGATEGPPPATESIKTIGILLMDHGSRNEASNQRLHELARMYREYTRSGNVVVAAAHMEIAKPSIPDGMQELIDRGVDEIICHPYFLSPGRHVQKDIPEIIEQAKLSMQIQIPVTTTDPVGSQTLIMLGAIDALVQQASGNLQQK